MKSPLQHIFNWFVKPVLKIYLKKDRRFRYHSMQLIIRKGVFHPQFFFSTKYLASFVEKLNPDKKTFLEPCAGSGLISLVALSKGAIVVSSDINPSAIENIAINFDLNKKSLKSNQLQIIQSDVFESIPVQQFDYIVVNPPYFFADFNSYEQAAWYAGKDGRFFSSFFEKLNAFVNNNSEIYMILADNCNIDEIQSIAAKHQWKLSLVEQKKILWETNYIFRILKM